MSDFENSTNTYRKLKKIGQGGFGTIYQGIQKTTNLAVAIKQIRIKSCGNIPISCQREIQYLSNLSHKNVIKFIEVIYSENLIYIILELFEYDLARLAKKTKFSTDKVKFLIFNIFEGVKYLHSNSIIHRDLKPSNILISKQGYLKLADFGLAKKIDVEVPNSLSVVTLWYRPPELLFGSDSQTMAIDIWSIGCIFGELLAGNPIFPGQSEIEQIDLIIKLLGTPTESMWPDLKNLKFFRMFSLKKQSNNKLRDFFPQLSQTGLDLLYSMFVYDPLKRISANDVLLSNFFLEMPKICEQQSWISFIKNFNINDDLNLYEDISSDDEF